MRFTIPAIKAETAQVSCYEPPGCMGLPPQQHAWWQDTTQPGLVSLCPATPFMAVGHDRHLRCQGSVGGRVGCSPTATLLGRHYAPHVAGSGTAKGTGLEGPGWELLGLLGSKPLAPPVHFLVPMPLGQDSAGNGGPPLPHGCQDLVPLLASLHPPHAVEAVLNDSGGGAREDLGQPLFESRRNSSEVFSFQGIA
eukprot:2356970-Lingulodinium_polyedra.AAC.2